MGSFIGYENLFLNGTLSASGEAAGFEKENAIDWITSDWWQAAAGGTQYLTVDLGSADSADYLGIASHDLFTQSATVTLQYSSDNFSGDINDAFTGEIPPSDGVYIKRFTTQSARYWRLKIVSTNPALIGQVSFGARMDIDEGPFDGFSPGQFSPKDKILNSITDGGQFLGRSAFRRGAMITIPFDFLAPAWVRTNWVPFQAHGILYPFFYAWDYDNFPDESAYCWSDGDWPALRANRITFMATELVCRAIV